MEKLDLAFAVGALALAGLVAGVLYALYPEWFSGFAESSDGTSIASSTYTTDEMTSSPIDNSTATQNTTSTADSASGPQPSNNSGY